MMRDPHPSPALSLDALRSIMLEGMSLTAVHNELTVLGVWLVVSFGLALTLFRWQ
jgi:hypothetical protein